MGCSDQRTAGIHMIIINRNLTDCLRNTHSQTARRVDITAQHISDTISSLDAQKPRLYHCVTERQNRADFHWPATKNNCNNFFPHIMQPFQHLLLIMGQPEDRFTCRFTGIIRVFTDTCDDDIAIRQPFQLGCLVGNIHKSLLHRPERLSHRHRRDLNTMLLQAAVQCRLLGRLCKRPSAENVGTVGKRTRKANFLTLIQRQQPAFIFQQDDTPRSSPAGNLQMFFAEMDLFFFFRVSTFEGILKQSEFVFQLQNPQYRFIYQRYVNFPLLYQFASLIQVVGGHHFNICARLQRIFCRLCPVCCVPMGNHLMHRAKIGDRDAVKAPFLPQNLAEHLFVAGRRNTVNRVEGGHRHCSTRVNRRFVSGQVKFP